MQPIRTFLVATGLVLEAPCALADPPCPACADEPAPAAQPVASAAPTVSAPPSDGLAGPAPRLEPLPSTRLHFDIGLTGGAIGLFYYNPPPFWGLAGFSVAAGWRAASRGRSSISAYGAFSYATVGVINDLRNVGYVEYTYDDRLGVAVGASQAAIVAISWFVIPMGYVGAPVRLIAYGFTERRQYHLHSAFIAAEFEPAIIVGAPGRADFGVRAFLTVGYAIH